MGVNSMTEPEVPICVRCHTRPGSQRVVLEEGLGLDTDGKPNGPAMQWCPRCIVEHSHDRVRDDLAALEKKVVYERQHFKWLSDQLKGMP